jgi:transcriptional/translational regulatory protein YebC/TACO1
LSGAAGKVYGGEFPGGLGVLVRVRDGGDGSSRHGAAQEIRGLFQHAGGRAGKAGWMFEDEWTLECSSAGLDAGCVDEIVAAAIDAGAVDVQVDAEARGVRLLAGGRREAAALKVCLESFAAVGAVRVDRRWRARGTVTVDGERWERMEALLERLRGRDDVLDIAHNAAPAGGGER